MTDLDDIRNLAWGIEDEDDEHDLCNTASRTLLECADEIARLRLTDAERDAISYYIDGVGGPATRVATLRGLLDRLG